MSKFHTFINWAKQSQSPIARLIRTLHASRQSLEVPNAMTSLYSPLLIGHKLIQNALSGILRIFYWTPLFKSQLKGPAKRLNLYGGLPFVSGPVQITCGSDCRISGQTTFSGRWSNERKTELIIGDNVGIGWQTTIAVGSKVILGDNVRLGGRNFLAGYPGHPLDATERAQGLADHEDQVGDIILEKDVWIGTGVMIMAGVTIGAETIVAAGSVVTKSFPTGVLVGGNPARIIRSLNQPKLEAAQ